MISKAKLEAYISLTRLNRPIGAYLVLWPTLWALWVAAEGFPRPGVLVIFVVGVFLMRSAGCIINDYADRDFDGHVKRTSHRPLPQGLVSSKEALTLFFVLILISFLLVLLTNRLTIYLSFGGAFLAIIYPFMKRHTYLPQVFLGAAFSWSIPMAYAAQKGNIDPIVWLLYTANLLWTVSYDTLYAMVDRDDDLKIGVKSTAILFGTADLMVVGLLDLLSLIALVMVGVQLSLGVFYYLALLGAAALFVWQLYSCRNRGRESCFKAFLNNNWVGAMITVGLILTYL